MAVVGNLRADGNVCESVDLAVLVLHNYWEQQVGRPVRTNQDPFWTLVDFKDSAHVAAERARHTIAEKRPRTSQDGTT